MVKKITDRHWGEAIFSMCGTVANGGGMFFGVWKMGGGRDIIRKYTFECGARPAAGTASQHISMHTCSRRDALMHYANLL